ncbi:MAG: hypothetical protein AUG85_06450 [Gemmatimonadetes bacterium 13_1_20CM_4_66_11]|nr:MAG: hypothetical protein AUG85_06450 [Gemmatimonadetes bacterium 13_1_20CM_4_66_11]
MLELILGILLAAGATYLVLLPILRPPEAASNPTGLDEGEDPADDMSPQTVALRALKEIEFDRATGELSDPDYEQLKAKYTAEALAAMRGDGGRVTGDESTRRVPTRPASPVPRPACPEHGTRSEVDAVFCSECGKRLGSAPGYCARCGTALADDARYCNHCGARVAA